MKIAIILEKGEYLEAECVKNEKGEILSVIPEEVDLILKEEEILKRR